MRSCDFCAKEYTPKNSRSRYCSDLCRAKAGNARKAARTAGAVVAVATDAPATPLTDATRAELEAAGLAETADGVLILTLATRIDAVPETSPALAALSKEYAARKSDLLSSARPAKANPYDELQALRERRRA